MATLKAQLGEKQAVQAENERLKLQLGSMQAQSLLDQRKAGEERSEKTQVYTFTGYVKVHKQQIMLQVVLGCAAAFWNCTELQMSFYK